MSIEFITTIDDYPWKDTPKRLLKEIRDKLTCTLYKEEVCFKFKKTSISNLVDCHKILVLTSWIDKK